MFTVDGTVYVPVSPSERTCDVVDCTYSPDNKEIVISDKVSNRGVELSVLSINPYSYTNNTHIESVSISNHGEIGASAFSGCSSLATATFGEEVTGIGEKAFYNCSALGEVVIPNAVTAVGTSAFEGCAVLENVSIGKGVPSLPQRVFYGCSSLPSLTIPNNVALVADYAFSGCTALSDLIIEDGTTTLELGKNSQSPLFVDCPLDEVYIGRKLNYSTASSAGYSPFYRNTYLRAVEITDAETQIYDNEFYGCSNLQTLKIGNGVTTIGKWAFSGCSAMQYFSAGYKVNSIGQEAFSDCTGLTSFYSLSVVPPTCGNQALDDINKWECALYVPEGHEPAYQAADQWKEFFYIYGGNEDVSIDGGVEVSVDGGVLHCGGVDTVVYTLAGAQVNSGSGDVELAAGAYIVVANGHATKVVVK